MRLAFLHELLAVTALCLPLAALTADLESASKESAQQNRGSSSKVASKSPDSAAGLFNRPVVFRGKLGDMPIQATVRPKEIAEEGLEGDYFFFGRSQKILLAGELEGESIFLEESENGTNISGQWEGKLQDGAIQGTWMSADGSVSKPFSLRPMQVSAHPLKMQPSSRQ